VQAAAAGQKGDAGAEAASLLAAARATRDVAQLRAIWQDAYNRGLWPVVPAGESEPLDELLERRTLQLDVHLRLVRPDDGPEEDRT
jgi:hypothetical protein